MAMGSRPAAASEGAGLARGAYLPIARPFAARSCGWTHGRAVHASPAGPVTCHTASYAAGLAGASPDAARASFGVDRIRVVPPTSLHGTRVLRGAATSRVSSIDLRCGRSTGLTESRRVERVFAMTANSALRNGRARTQRDFSLSGTVTGSVVRRG